MQYTGSSRLLIYHGTSNSQSAVGYERRGKYGETATRDANSNHNKNVGNMQTIPGYVTRKGPSERNKTKFEHSDIGERKIISY